MRFGLVGTGPWAELALGPGLVAADGVERVGIWGARHAYAELGIPVRMVMPQNEFNSAQVFPTCTWTPEGLARFIRHLAPQMQLRGVDWSLGTLERSDDGRSGSESSSSTRRIALLDPETAEIHELAPFVGAFSARTAQIRANIDRYEAEWRAEHPGDEPGPRLREAWDRLGPPGTAEPGRRQTEAQIGR